MDLRQFRQFIAVAEELHFRRAAERLAISQPPLTAAVQRLEHEVGAVLIERGRRTVALTAAGRAFLTEAKAAVAHAERAMTAARDAAAGRTGLVRLGYIGSAMYGRLPAALRRFRRSHPDVRLELLEATTAAQVAWLRDGTLGLAVLIPPLREDGGLILRPFDRDRLAIALPAAHRLAERKPIVLAELSDEPFILWPNDQGPGFHLRAMRLCAQAGFAPRVVQEAHSMHGVLSLVAAEAGVSLVPANMARARSGGIVYVPLAGEEAAFDLMLCHRADRIEPATQALLLSLMGDGECDSARLSSAPAKDI